MRRSIATALTVLLSIAVSAGEVIRLPDKRTGVIDGKMATLVWPAHMTSWSKHDLISPANCTAHFESVQDRDTDLARPCGQWLRLPPGSYRVWLEGNGYISPYAIPMGWMDEPFRGEGMPAVMPVVPAGLVALEPDVATTPDVSFRLLSLNAEFLGSPQRPFDRRVRDVRKPVAMPGGAVVAGLFDRKTSDAIALARPVHVRPGATVRVRPELPRDGSDVLVVLDRAVSNANEKVTLTLTDARGSSGPDAVVQGVGRVFAVWYGARGRTATLTAGSATLHLPPATLSLRPHRVTTLRTRLLPRPRLSVTVTTPDDVFGKLEVAIATADDPGEIRRAEVTPGAPTIFEGLPLERLRVQLSADEWEFAERVDLRDGDREVSFVLQPAVVRGRVTVGRDPAAGAEVAFESGENRWKRVATDDRGEYEVVLPEPGHYIARITAPDRPPYHDPFVEVTDGARLDFRLPANRFTVRVTDARSGSPITGAEVGVQNIWETDNGRRSAFPYFTDREGVASLPPLRPGRVLVRVKASRYAAAGPREFTVEDDTKQDVDIALTPLDNVARFGVVLPDGAPAVGAEACLLAEPRFEEIVWRDVADGDGFFEVAAASRRGVVVIRHPHAASSVRPLELLDGTTLQLRAPSPPLRLRVVAGEERPARFAFLTLWIDGVRLYGVGAAFASWTDDAIAGFDGDWSGRNLPPGPLRLLATRRAAPAHIASGAYDSLAANIAFPWPVSSVTIAAAD